MIVSGDSLADIIVELTKKQAIEPPPGSILVVAQKVVSKAEGRIVDLKSVKVSKKAQTLAHSTGKDPRLVELILQESRSIIRTRHGLLITEHRTGHILANAGIDISNVSDAIDSDDVLLWPEDPDASAHGLSARLSEAFGFFMPVIINDSLGRPWRLGTVGSAIGSYGLEPVWNQVGETDLFGQPMHSTAPAMADAIAAAASLVQGETDQGLPVVWVTGCAMRTGLKETSRSLLRPPDQDMFR